MPQSNVARTYNRTLLDTNRFTADHATREYAVDVIAAAAQYTVRRPVVRTAFGISGSFPVRKAMENEANPTAIMVIMQAETGTRTSATNDEVPVCSAPGVGPPSTVDSKLEFAG